MAVELRTPSFGESITEALVSRWLKKEGDLVEQDEPIVVLETDKVTAEVPAPRRGVLQRIVAAEGRTTAIGEVIALIDESAAAIAGARPAPPAVAPRSSPPAPLAPTLGKAAPAPPTTAPAPPLIAPGARREELVPMTPLRRTIAERLVHAQQTAALLTTFNEIDMSSVVELRRQVRALFEEKYGVKLGFMSFFVKAAVESLKLVPHVNAQVEPDAILFRNYYDIAVAVGGGRGVVAPVIRNADQLSFAEIERMIADFGQRARDNRLTLEEITGGTFTISNGGVYGSMLSTPIVNHPQSAILGLHAIQDRPVARDGQVAIRPMMYVALTYDHRIIDGREAVTFLGRVKECIEEPSRMLLEV